MLFVGIRKRTRQQNGENTVEMRARLELVHHRFDDFDEFCETVRGWNMKLQRFDRGPFEAELLQTAIGSVQLTRTRFEGRLHQLGTPPPGVWTFGIPQLTSTPFVWRGYEIDPGQILIFRPGSELDSVSGRGFRVFTCSFPETLLEQVAFSSGLPLPSRGPGSAEVVRPPKVALQAIRNLLLAFCDALENDPSLAHSCVRQRQLQYELPSLILEGLAAGSDVRPPRPVGTRKLLLDRAMSHIAEHACSPLTVGEISASIGANERTLRRAFLDRFGVPPKTYLAAVRLDGVRRDLRRSDPESSVIDVANRWSFWHMGDLAMKYRQAFGELPSATLRKQEQQR
jgi:AraC family ethanolamine operon transcriptional activator